MIILTKWLISSFVLYMNKVLNIYCSESWSSHTRIEDNSSKLPLSAGEDKWRMLTQLKPFSGPLLNRNDLYQEQNTPVKFI